MYNFALNHNSHYLQFSERFSLEACLKVLKWNMSAWAIADWRCLALVRRHMFVTDSRPVLGCMSYGSDTWAKWVLNEDKSLPLLKAAWDAGIQTWDTADIYSNVTQNSFPFSNTGRFGNDFAKGNWEIQDSSWEIGYSYEMLWNSSWWSLWWNARPWSS